MDSGLSHDGHCKDSLCHGALAGVKTRSEAGPLAKGVSGHGSDPTWVVLGTSPRQNIGWWSVSGSGKERIKCQTKKKFWLRN